MGSDDGVGRSLSELPFRPRLPARLGWGPGVPQFQTQFCLSLLQDRGQARVPSEPLSLHLCSGTGAAGED